MDAIILAGGNFQNNLKTHPIKNFYSTFPMHNMKSQIKIKKIGSSDLKENSLDVSFPRKVHQIILGSLLGDMYCKKECLNSNIEETHSVSQKDYLAWKYANLKNYLDLKLYAFNNPICKIKGKTYLRKKQIRLRSKVSEKLNIYNELFYKDNKKFVNPDILNQLGSLGIAVWYCDDGYYDPENKTAQLHTEGFSLKENNILKRWLRKKWNISANFKKDPSKNKVLLRFPVKESDKFLNLIKEHIFDMPESIWYKLGHVWGGNIHKINKAKLNKLKRTKIYQSKVEVKIKRNQQSKEFYIRNRKKILNQKAECRKTEKYKKYIREYHQRPDVKQRMREIQRRYRQKPETKKKVLIYRREYRKRPEVREKIRQYNKKSKRKKKR